MPIYDYECTQCRIRLEIRHSISADSPYCPACGGVLVKLILTAPAMHGYMAHGREQAMRSLETKAGQVKHRHGPGCGCG
ncbi:MAG: FmdB family zinc ribbon protein [Burkholderiales bacterium]